MFWKKKKKEDYSYPENTLRKTSDEGSESDYGNLYSELKSDSTHLSHFENVEKQKVVIPTASELISDLKQEELSREEELAHYLDDNSQDILDGIMQDIKNIASEAGSIGFVEYEKHFDF